MKPLKNVFLCSARDGLTSVANYQSHLVVVLPSDNSNSASRSIVLSCVLQKVLHNQRCVPFFAGDEYFGWEFVFHCHIERVGKRPQIIKPFFDELAEIHRLRRDLKVTGIEAG